MKNLKKSISIVQEIVSKRWVSEILFSIYHQHHKYTDILQSIPFLSSTEFRRKLKLLLEFRLILKNEKGEYKLTVLGDDIIEIMIKASEFSERLADAQRMI